jgi:hypothetical protein
MPAQTRVAPTVYELHVELENLHPPIWRRILVPGSIKLSKLHALLQRAMGWTDSHLHSFEIGEKAYSAAYADLDELEMLDEKKYTLEKALGDSVREFIYEYDFGDRWRHRVKVQAVAEPKAEWSYPLCIAGERAAPPDDVGGVAGYFEFLAAIKNPFHNEHESMLTWAGGAFDSEGFDLNAVNRSLRYGRL